MGWSWPFSSGNSNQDETSAPSPAPAAAATNAQPNNIALTDEQRMRIFGKPGPSSSTTSSQTRDQQADADLDAFLKSIEATGDDSASPASASASKQAAPYQSPTRILPTGDLDISPDALLPRTMSCRQQFDQAFYCQSLGGKFNDIYRYGHLKSCSEQWGAFWFCMRTRALPEHEKEEAVREFYRKRDERRREEWGSSEDVWEVRKVGVRRAFWRDPYAEEEGGEVQTTGSGRVGG